MHYIYAATDKQAQRKVWYISSYFNPVTLPLKHLSIEQSKKGS